MIRKLILALILVSPNVLGQSAAGNPFYNILTYGADPTGSSDSTAAIQAAIHAAIKGGIVFFPCGDYKTSGTLRKPQSFTGPSIMGAGYDCTAIHYSGSSGTAAIYIQGGSGALSGIKIEGLDFNGTRGTWGIEIDGQDGVLIDRCKFDGPAIGVVFANRTRGAFAEYDVVEHSDFTSNTATAMRYLKGPDGANSFHGSGMRYCTAQATGPPVIIVDNQAFPYNAPLSMQVWVSANTTIIQNNNNGNPTPWRPWWCGTITLEESSGRATLASDRLCSAGGTACTSYVGQIISTNRNLTYGALTVFRNYIGLSNGAHNATPESSGLSAALTTGTNVIPTPLLDFSDGFHSVALVYITLEAPNYDYAYVFLYTHNPWGRTSSLIQLANPRSSNSSGYGAPTITTDAKDDIIITDNKYPPSGVSASVSFSSLGWDRP